MAFIRRLASRTDKIRDYLSWGSGSPRGEGLLGRRRREKAINQTPGNMEMSQGRKPHKSTQVPFYGVYGSVGRL
jgi:hypothetical protein